MALDWFRLSAIGVVLLPVLGGIIACSKGFEDTMQRGHHRTAVAIEKVLEQHTEQLMAIPGVVGTAIGECNGNPCIKVLAVKKTAELVKKIPPNLDVFPVVIDETGPIRALD
jgi:hypothetical protein